MEDQGDGKKMMYHTVTSEDLTMFRVLLSILVYYTVEGIQV